MLSRKLYYVGHRILCLGWEILKSTSGNLPRTWTSRGGHDGRLAVSVLSNLIADIPNIGFVVSAGNEGNRGRHYRGIIDPITGYNTVELNVGEGETGFSMEIWGDSPGIFSIDIQSPSGEYIPRVAPSLTVQRDISFIFERTVISMDYFTVEAETGDQLILLRFKNISLESGDSMYMDRGTFQ